VAASIIVRNETSRVVLTYKHRYGGKGWTNETYPVYLDRTPCNLGGERPWFLCPAKGCQRRAAILYGAGIFACRRCYQLVYQSQRETSDDRILRRAHKIREKLGWKRGILNPNGPKPKEMHWDTYVKLVQTHDAIVNRVLLQLNERFRLLDFPLSDDGGNGRE